MAGMVAAAKEARRSRATGSAADSAQQAMTEALGVWSRALRRDECGDWRISGKQGGIYADPAGGYRLFVTCHSVRAWTATKKRLAFCAVVQDGDDEGVLILAAIPTPEQAIVIRDVLGVRKRRELSPGAVADLLEHGVKSRFQARQAA